MRVFVMRATGAMGAAYVAAAGGAWPSGVRSAGSQRDHSTALAWRSKHIKCQRYARRKSSALD